MAKRKNDELTRILSPFRKRIRCKSSTIFSSLWGLFGSHGSDLVPLELPVESLGASLDGRGLPTGCPLAACPLHLPTWGCHWLSGPLPDPRAPLCHHMGSILDSSWTHSRGATWPYFPIFVEVWAHSWIRMFLLFGSNVGSTVEELQFHFFVWF